MERLPMQQPLPEIFLTADSPPAAFLFVNSLPAGFLFANSLSANFLFSNLRLAAVSENLQESGTVILA